LLQTVAEEGAKNMDHAGLARGGAIA